MLYRKSAIVTALLSLLAARTAQASGNTCTWTGSAGGTWGIASNWSCSGDGGVPGVGDTAVFTASETVVLGASTAVNTIYIDGGTSTTFNQAAASGAVLTVADGVSVLTNSTVNFTVPLQLETNVVFSAVPTAFVETGNVSFTAPVSLTLEGGGNFQLGSAAPLETVSGPGSVVASSTGTVSLPTANSYDGGTEITAGRLSGAVFGAFGPGPIVVGGDGGLIVGAAGTYSNPLVLESSFSPSFEASGATSAIHWNGPIVLAGPSSI